MNRFIAVLQRKCLFYFPMMARVERIELPFSVLETAVLPLYDTRIWHPDRDSNPERRIRSPMFYPVELSGHILVGSTGIEPVLAGPQSAVLPIHQPPHMAPSTGFEPV